jgi:hypothetical protein
MKESLQPTHPRPGLPVETQAEKMRELRSLHDHGEHQRCNDLMVAWKLSDSLSPADMATACRTVVGEVSNRIRTTYALDRANRTAELHARAARHVAPGLPVA